MVFFYLILLLGLGIYSYSQIDLNLTLLQTPWFLAFQHQMIQLGYFNRSLSTVIFIGITLMLIVGYLVIVNRSDTLSVKNVRVLLVGLSLLALFSYPAFSHDIFNYLYSGRIVFVYHANPYQLTPLDFPADTWTRFMQWTHVPFAWGPGYLILLLPFYLLGLGKFTLTLLSFKLMALLGFLGSGWVINKLSGKKGLLFFALNPLVIYEGLVAGHMDILMLFFALLAIYYWNTGRKVYSWLSLVVSIGIKYATIVLAPVFFLKKDLKKHINLIIILGFVSALGQFLFRELLPHYFLVPFGLTALAPESKFWRNFVIVLSFTLLLIRYLPFVFSGNWNTIRLPLSIF